MKCGLGGQAAALADRTGTARQTATAAAILPRIRCDMGLAGCNIIAIVKGTHRAGGCAGLACAGQAGLRPRASFWRFAPPDGPTERHKQACFIMYQKTQGRRPEPPRLFGPCKERCIGRAAKGEQGGAAKCFSQGGKNAQRPAIKRVRLTVPILCTASEDPPEAGFVRSNQRDCCRTIRAIAQGPQAQWCEVV